MIQEIRQLVKNQSTDMARLRSVVERPPNSSPLACRNRLCPGSRRNRWRYWSDGRQGSAADDDVIDAEFRPRS